MASLARKRMAAGSLFRDAAGRVLPVEPTYKPAVARCWKNSDWTGRSKNATRNTDSGRTR